MVNTSSHPWTVNGNRLDTLAHNIELKDGWVNAPGMRGANARVPGRHGELWVPNKRYEPGFAVLSMWVSHTDADGMPVGTDKYFQMRKNFDALMNIFESSYGLLDVRQQIGPSAVTDVRQALCEVTNVITPNFEGNIFGKFKVGLEIPGVFWQDVSTQDWTSPTGAAAIATHNVTTMQGATAPMEDLQFQVYGPLTSARVTDTRTGHYIQLNEAIPSGQIWEVDTSKWTSVVGAAPGFNGTGTNKTAVTTAAGLHSPRLFALARGNPPSVQLAGTGTSALTKLVIRSRRKYK